MKILNKSIVCFVNKNRISILPFFFVDLPFFIWINSNFFNFWVCYDQTDITYRVGNNRCLSVVVCLSLRLSFISYIDGRKLLVLDDSFFIFWNVFRYYEYKVSPINGFGEIINSLRAVGAGGVGDLDLVFLWVVFVCKAWG